MYNINIVCNFAMKTNNTMTFDKILDDGSLWAVRYDNEQDNCFDSLFAGTN